MTTRTKTNKHSVNSKMLVGGSLKIYCCFANTHNQKVIVSGADVNDENVAVAFLK